MSKERVITIPVGPHGHDGVEIEIFTRQLIAMRLKVEAERARTSLLTKEQATRLRDALDELIRELESAAPCDPQDCEPPRLRAA